MRLFRIIECRVSNCTSRIVSRLYIFSLYIRISNIYSIELEKSFNRISLLSLSSSLQLDYFLLRYLLSLRLKDLILTINTSLFYRR